MIHVFNKNEYVIKTTPYAAQVQVRNDDMYNVLNLLVYDGIRMCMIVCASEHVCVYLYMRMRNTSACPRVCVYVCVCVCVCVCNI